MQERLAGQRRRQLVYAELGRHDITWRDHSIFPSGSRAWDVEVDNLSGSEHQSRGHCRLPEGRRSHPRIAVGGGGWLGESQHHDQRGMPEGLLRRRAAAAMRAGVLNDMHILNTRPSGNKAWSIDTYTSLSYAGSQEAYVICDPKNSHDYSTVHRRRSADSSNVTPGNGHRDEGEGQMPEGLGCHGRRLQLCRRSECLDRQEPPQGQADLASQGAHVQPRPGLHRVRALPIGVSHSGFVGEVRRFASFDGRSPLARETSRNLRTNAGSFRKFRDLTGDGSSVVATYSVFA